MQPTFIEMCGLTGTLLAPLYFAMFADGTASPVKEREGPSSCKQCGKPTWSAYGLCVRCRGAPTVAPVTSTEIEPPPIVAHSGSQVLAREVTTDADGRIAEDVCCRACGYNLRGLMSVSACPECSLPVGLSIRGDLLQFSNPQWVQRLVSGVRFIIAGIFASIAFSIVHTVLEIAVSTTGQGAVPVRMAMGIIGVAVSAVFVIGVWLLTTKDVGGVESERLLSARHIARWGIVIALAHWPIQIACTATMGTGAPTMAAGPMGAPAPWFLPLMLTYGVVSVAAMVAHLAGLILLRALAWRIPRGSLAKQTSIVIWGYGVSLAISVPSGLLTQWLMFGAMGTPNPNPALMGFFLAFAFGNCLGSLGALTFGIWTIVLLFLYSGSFARCAAAAQEMWTKSMAMAVPPPVPGVLN